ncbi:SRPBCC family protein [Kribbella sp. NPDC055071]
MVDILHRIGVESSVKYVYETLATIDGLAGWWTEDTRGDSELDGVIRFRFAGAPAPGGFDMKVLETVPDKLVRWKVVEGPEEWVGTVIRFELSQDGDFAIVMFRHEGWREPVPFMYHCSTKWATFLMSLKKLVETGSGDPAPDDVRISNWH